MDNDDLLHEILSGIRDVVKDIQSSQKETRQDIAEIKLDVSHHILRTDLLQEEQKEQKVKVEQLQKDAWKLKGAFALVGLLLTILSVFALYKH